MAAQEFLILDGAGPREHATIDILDSDGTRRTHDYDAGYNDGNWYPSRDVDAGEPDAMVMLIRPDRRTELVVGRNRSGAFTGVMLRSVSPDGTAMTVTRTGSDGKIMQIRVLDKQ